MFHGMYLPCFLFLMFVCWWRFGLFLCLGLVNNSAVRMGNSSWKLSLGSLYPSPGVNTVPRVRTLSAFYWTLSQYCLCSWCWPRTNNLPDISAAKVLTQSRQRIAIWDLQSWWAIVKSPHGKGRRMLLWGGKEAGRALVNKESTA